MTKKELEQRIKAVKKGKSEDQMEDNNLRDYVRWLIIDQCEKLLNMKTSDIAILIGISRPTLNRLMYDYSGFTIEHIEKLERHLNFTKAALLISEAKDD